MARTRSRRRRAIVVGLLSTLVLGGIIALVTLLLGKVEGTEFAPTHFTARTFSFWELPLLHLQVSPIQRNPETLPVTNHLRSQSLVQVPKAAPTEWHLVELRRGVNRPALADAEILTSYLELHDGAAAVWEQWSTDHPQAARIFWPVVQRLARRELYILLPELFELAAEHTDPPVLARKIDAYLLDAYLSLAEDLSAAERPQLAAAVLKDAAEDFPDHPRVEALQRSLGATGQP